MSEAIHGDEPNAEKPKISDYLDQIGFWLDGVPLNEALKVSISARKQREAEMPTRKPTREDYLKEYQRLNQEQE